MAIITLTVNIKVYIQILDNFLIPSIENMFDDKEVICQDENVPSHRAKRVKTFLHDKNINNMKWPANSLDLTYSNQKFIMEI